MLAPTRLATLSRDSFRVRERINNEASARMSLPGFGAACSAAAVAACCLASPAMAAPATPQRPAAGDGFSISLAASSASAPVRQSVTLTATTNTDVGPTQYYITIYSETTGAELATCGFGTTCTATVAQATPGTQNFEAFVGDDVPGNGHPGFALASSNDVQVSWWFILRGMRESRGHAPGGPQA